MMESCDCIETYWPADELLVKYQYISDFLIAIAYFSIPLEIIYFVQKSSFFPYRWVLMQFSAFITLCGATHLINLWTFYMHSKTVAFVLTIAKISTAVVSCATALMLVYIIPELLNVKIREILLKNKAEEMDREMGLMIRQEETSRHIRMLIHEIRSTLDRHTILKTTLVELGRILGLEECALWMPSMTGLNLQLSNTLSNILPIGSTVPINLPIVNEVFGSSKAIRIPYTCPLVNVRPCSGESYEVIAVRVPLLHLPHSWPELSVKGSYGVMVLVLNGVRKWHNHEVQLVEVVVDQVSVALSHAAILEESTWAQDQLVQQNVALDLARREAERAIYGWNECVGEMNEELGRPMSSIIWVCSMLLETELGAEQRGMVDTILKSNHFLATVVNDALQLSKLEDGTLKLDSGIFNLQAAFTQVVSLIRPIASLKKLSVTLTLAADVPVYAMGDEQRLEQILLMIASNAIKFTKEGYVAIEASVPKLDVHSSDHHFYLLVQVRDSGCGISTNDIHHVFASNRASTAAAGFGLPICKRFVKLMGGHIWVESEGLGKGSTFTFLVQLGTCRSTNELGDRENQRDEVFSYSSIGSVRSML